MVKLNKKKKAYLLVGLGLIILALGILLSISLGANDMSFATTIQSLFSSNVDINTKIVKDLRLPRAIAAVLVGGFLAVSGAKCKV